MIVVQILGGLGNQMFQYALGRAIALRTGEQLRLEIGRRNPSHLGKFDLDRFNIKASVVGVLESAVLWRPLERLVEPSLAWLGLCDQRWLHRVYRQRSLLFDPAVLDVRGPVFLVGHWQCERYFASIATLLRQELTVRDPPDQANARLLRTIEGSTSVCVHIRRQDYVHDPKVAAGYNVCDLDYYEAARGLLESKVKDPHYFVFSDDPEWGRKNLVGWGRITIVDHNRPEDRHEDFRLMAACRYFIVANSSFSWWPAWLSAGEDKIVVAPLRWSPVTEAKTQDLVPAGWARV